jgi:hypothetical protein
MLEDLRDPVRKPAPPSDHIPLRRRCVGRCAGFIDTRMGRFAKAEPDAFMIGKSK